jgi:hypothetical protein
VRPLDVGRQFESNAFDAAEALWCNKSPASVARHLKRIHWEMLGLICTKIMALEVS